MILARASRYCLAAAALFAASGAQADVMEVTPEGARWVAGGPVVLAANTDMMAFSDMAGTDLAGVAVADTGAVIVDERIVARPADHAAAIPAQYSAKIHELARRFDLSPALLEALVWQESRWRANAVSPVGARGLAQLMPGTARYLGVDPDDPMQNLEGGARYLREQLDRFDGDLEKALAAYNAGPGRVIRADGVPNIRETKLYVAAIMGRLANHSRPSQTLVSR